jgi:hypothetical protein
MEKVVVEKIELPGTVLECIPQISPWHRRKLICHLVLFSCWIIFINNNLCETSSRY